jgi:hypothetical protein
VVWLKASMTAGDRRSSVCQLRRSHWQSPSALARDFATPLSPDSRMACESPISAGTPKRS